MDDIDLDNVSEEPIAIVIGGTGEIGEGLVQHLVDDGYRVVVPTRDPLRADGLLERLGDRAARVQTVVTDVTTDDGVARLRDALATAPRVVVSCLGSTTRAGPLVAVPPEAFDKVIASNLRAHYLVARGLAPLVASAHGVYAVIAGLGAHRVVRGSGPLSVAAAGQLALAEVLAAELPSLHVVALALATPVRTRSRNRSSALGVEEVASALISAIHDPHTRGMTLVIDKGPTVSVRHPMLELFRFTGRAEQEAAVDEALNESFPASDPPAWTLGRSRG